MPTSRLFRNLALLSAFVASTASTALSETPLSLGVTGSTPSDPSRNPTEILAPEQVQQLMLAIAERPHSREEIWSAVSADLFSIDDAMAVGLLREEDGLFYIDFNLLRVADQRRILEVGTDLGRELAAAFLQRRDQIEALAVKHRQSPELIGELLYIVLGCFSLDWDGLALTEELGYRAGAQRSIDGYAFTPWAKEKGAEMSLRGLYWGSHNESPDGITVTTFGDHDALPRFGLPDILWRSPRAFADFEDLPQERRVAGQMLFAYALDAMADASKVMMEVGRADLTVEQLGERIEITEDKLEQILKLLEAADYLEQRGERYHATALVLQAEDAELVKSMVATGRDIMTRWHEVNYDRVRQALADLTPVRNGVPFERVYTEVWHFIFGIANRTLVEEGLFADPYADDRRHQGFLPVVWSNNLTAD